MSIETIPDTNYLDGIQINELNKGFDNSSSEEVTEFNYNVEENTELSLLWEKINLILQKIENIQLIPGPEGKRGLTGLTGEDGKDGIDGKSAYDLARLNGFEGTIEDWLLSLIGPAGQDGKDGMDGQDGIDGKSFTFDMFTAEEIEILRGPQGPAGKDAYQQALDNGFIGTIDEWFEFYRGKRGSPGYNGQPGLAGKDLYQMMVEAGYEGSKEEFLEIYFRILNGEFTGGPANDNITVIEGPQGPAGKDGKDGRDGKDGTNGINGRDGLPGIDGKDGKDGANGKSNYELALEDGFEGTLTDYLQSIKGEDGKDGRDLYQIALDTGYNGTEADFLEYMRPKDGKDGKDGESVYQLAQRIDNFTGTELEFLDSLKGTDGKDGLDGKSAYERAVDLLIPSIIKLNDIGEPIVDPETGDPQVKTEEEWLESLKGINGKDGGDIYDLAVELGYTGSKEEFLASAMGPQGPAGKDGKDGTNGIDGINGKDGRDGKDGIDGKDGKDADLEAISHLDIKNLYIDEATVSIDGGSGSQPQDGNYTPPYIAMKKGTNEIKITIPNNLSGNYTLTLPQVSGTILTSGNLTVDNLTSTKTDMALSANQGRILKASIDNINTLLTSNDTSLDTLQEVVDFIKVNKNTLSALTIPSIAGLETALSEKQALLISGTNIKTVNNNSLLGSGNIDLGLSNYTLNSEFNTKSETFIKNYLPSGLKGELPFVKNNGSNDFQMDTFMKIGHFVNNPDQIEQTKGFVKSFQEIFNTWERFSHIHSNEAQPASASDMAAWQYSAANDSIVQPNNTPTLTGFVSDEMVDEYNHEVILRSTQTDDDAIGLVIAFTTDDVGREHHLTVYVRKNIGNHYAGTSVQDVNTHYALCYNYHRSDKKLLVDGSSTTGLGPYVDSAQGGWSKYPLGVRIRVERRGDIIKVWRSAWSTTSNALVPSTLLELDLRSDPLLAKFRGKSKYGYFALSQGGATFEIVEGVKTFESMIFDLTTGNIQEFKAGTWQVNPTEKIQNYVSPGRLLYNKYLGKLFYYVGDVGTVPTVVPIELK